MKPVFQDLTLPVGNCFQACLASLFELPIEDVPHFMLDGNEWWDNFNKWLETKGYFAIDLEYAPHLMHKLKGYWIATGIAKRGILHSVIYCDNHLCHDPHPSQVGIEDVQMVTVLCKIFRDESQTA